MARTLINLPDDDKDWLDHEARDRRVSMAELVRVAVRRYRVQEESRHHPNLQALLAQTRGLWRRGDGLAWQRKARNEWGERH